MSDMLNAGGGPVTRQIGNANVTFAELSFNDRRDLLREHRQKERDAIKVLFAETGIQPEQQYMELRQFDSELVGSAAFSRFFFSDDGKAAILAKSIDKVPGQEKTGEALVKQITWTDEEVLHLCALLCHVELVKPKEKDDPGNPQTRPLAYGR